MPKSKAKKRKKKKKDPKPKAAEARVKGNPKCRGCPSLCCHDLVMPITRPRDREDEEELRWQVQYDTVHIFIANYRWHLLVKARCQYLDGNGWCTRYEDRPDKCRRHNPPDCERYGSFYDVMIDTPEELDAYLAKERKRRAKRRRKANKNRSVQAAG